MPVWHCAECRDGKTIFEIIHSFDMNREEIKNYLPHREPMLLVDDMTIEGDTAIGHYHVRGDEHFLQGHFPDYPVVPGVILCEIMGQCSSILMLDELPGRLTFYAGMDKVRFKNQVRPV